MALRLNNILIESRSIDNFINATQLCKAGGKVFAKWYRLDSTKELIDEMLKTFNVQKWTLRNLIDKRIGGRHSGTWIHPDLAIQLAQWISAKFAIQVSKWIRELFITGSVSIESKKSDEELTQLQRRVFELEEENRKNIALLEEKEETLDRIHNIQKELLSYKKRVSREETIYIVSTEEYARQGIYKIGRTKTKMSQRNSGHNNTHIKGDKVKVLREFKVNDATLVEKNIHTKLSGLLVDGEKEFFMCPFNLLESVVDLIVHNDDEENETVNKIVDTVFKLKQIKFNSRDWVSGIPEGVFDEVFEMKQGDKNIANFNVTSWTEEHKKEFIDKCIQEYVKQQNKANQQYQIVWKAFQPFFIEQLNISKSKFRATEWKPEIKNAIEKKEQLSIKWKN